MPPLPIRIEYRSQIFTIDFNDLEGLDVDLVKAQIFSMTDVEPNHQLFQPELNIGNLHQVLKLTERHSDLDNDIDAEIVLSSIDWRSCCSRIWLGDTPAVQPSVLLGGRQICLPCISSCGPQVAPQFNPSTSKFVCQCEDRCIFQSRVSPQSEVLAGPSQQFLVQALAEQTAQYVQAMKMRGNASFNDRIQSNLRQIADFEDADNQRRALSMIPLDILLERGKARGDDAFSPRDELVFQLLHWFKNEFFQWVNSPPCNRCGKETSANGHSAPLPEERRFGAGITELHKCGSCGNITRFPRYNHSGKLMETRKGRCGEWAQAFVLCCRALKFDTRFVVDWTDHVWAEVYSEARRRWVHCDPCENRYDSPLLYESGWGKKLTYVIAFSVHEVRDVTRRYTTKYDSEVLSRRTACQEEWLQATLERLSENIQSRNPAGGYLVQQRWALELQELNNTINSREQDLPGRQTGSTEWRRARGELGKETSDEVPTASNVSKKELQALIQAYLTQMMSGCGRQDCDNRQYCKSAHDSDVKCLSQKALLTRSIVAVRDFMDSKLCSRINSP